MLYVLIVNNEGEVGNFGSLRVLFYASDPPKARTPT